MKACVAVLGLLLFAIPLVLVADEKNDQAVKKAVEAANAWLAIVDQGKYAESWEAAAKYLQDAVTRDQFEKSLKAVRKPLGAVKSRWQHDDGLDVLPHGMVRPGTAAQSFGFVTRPMKAMLPVRLSRIRKTNGWSARKTGGSSG